MKNKIFTRIIITTLLCAFLTVNVGKVTRVSAVGTTIAASAAAALCAVGIVYCSYMALTGASVHVPDTVESIETWLTDMGTKVVQYPAGREAYNELYSHNLALSPEGNLIRDFIDSEVWTWTAAKLRSWANDFSSIDVINSIAGYTAPYDGYHTDYDYSNIMISEWTSMELRVNGSVYNPYTIYFSSTATYNVPSASRVLTKIGANTYDLHCVDTSVNYRNVLHSDGKYSIQRYYNNSWSVVSRIPAYVEVNNNGYISYMLYSGGMSEKYYTYSDNIGEGVYVGTHVAYPPLTDAVIYDEVNGTTTETLTGELVNYYPQYPVLPPEDDNKPVIPYVKLPYDPTWDDPLGGPSGGGNWGLRLGDLLDLLEELAGLMMEIGSIGELINQFKDLIDGQSGDEYYIYYDDSTNNYYQYYTITNFGDNIYNYDIDVSEVDEHLPVDLNTIQTYSSNRYLEQIKQSAINGSSIVRDFAVFWYNVDPEVTYIFLGICILILIGAFTGKLGHS